MDKLYTNDYLYYGDNYYTSSCNNQKPYCNNMKQELKNMIRFFGFGSAFSTENNNSFEFEIPMKRYGITRFIYEMPMTTCKEYILRDELVDRYVIMISHLHEDHVGGLATFLQYIYFKYGINIYSKHRLQIICPNKEDMQNYLKLTMGNLSVEKIAIIDSPMDIDFCIKYIRIIPIETRHVNGMNCCGFITQVDNESFYYTGDCYEIPEEIINLFNNKKITFMISELSKTPNPVHLDIQYFDEHFNIKDIEDGRIIFTHNV